VKDLWISSYRTNMGDVDLSATDEVKLGFSIIEFEYKQQKADGSMSAPVKGGYDLRQNRKL